MKNNPYYEVMKNDEFKEDKYFRSLHGETQAWGDLLEEITNFCIKEDIRLGWIRGLGAVEKARLAYYDQTSREYQFFELDKRLEITNLAGNISIKDGKPMAHVHVTLGDDKGNCYGGHVSPGTVIFACEIIIQALEGPEFVRGFDEITGLPLWEMG